MDINDLCHIDEIQLTYRNRINPNERPQINNSWEAYQLLLKCWEPGKIEMVEEFKLLLLNTKSRVLGMVNVASGSAFIVPIDYKMIFAPVIKSGATSMIVAHNHPSGDHTPSISDKVFTQKLDMAAALLDIRLMDHMIITLNGYYSFLDEDLIVGRIPRTHLDCKG